MLKPESTHHRGCRVNIKVFTTFLRSLPLKKEARKAAKVFCWKQSVKMSVVLISALKRDSRSVCNFIQYANPEVTAGTHKPQQVVLYKT